MGLQCSLCRAAQDVSNDVPGDSALNKADGPHFPMKEASPPADGSSTNEKAEEVYTYRRLDPSEDRGAGKPEHVEVAGEDPAASAIDKNADGAEANSKVTLDAESKPIEGKPEVMLDDLAKLGRLTENGTNGAITNGVTGSPIAEKDPAEPLEKQETLATNATEDGVEYKQKRNSEVMDSENADKPGARRGSGEWSPKGESPRGKDAEEVLKKDARKKQKDTSSTQPRKAAKDASDAKKGTGQDTWRVLKGKDAFIGSDVDAIAAKDLDLCKKICKDRGYGAFVVWEGVACFRAQRGSECLDNLVDAPQATMYIYITKKEEEDMAAAQAEKEEKAKGNATGKAKGKAKAK